MAILSDEARFAAWALLMREHSFGAINGDMTKVDLRAAVDALDVFLDTNSAAINTAIPQPARGVLSTRQKAMLLMFVISHRFLVEI